MCMQRERERERKRYTHTHTHKNMRIRNTCIPKHKCDTPSFPYTLYIDITGKRVFRGVCVYVICVCVCVCVCACACLHTYMYKRNFLCVRVTGTMTSLDAYPCAHTHRHQAQVYLGRCSSPGLSKVHVVVMHDTYIHEYVCESVCARACVCVCVCVLVCVGSFECT